MPKILIDTPRLQMREFTLDDAEAVVEFNANEEVTRYTGDAGMVKTLEDAKGVITDVWLAEYKKYGYARYALIHKGDNKIIGFCGVKFLEEEGLPDVGYRMLPEYWGQGLGTEAVQATMDYARDTLGLTKIIAEAVVENTASNHILKKVGLRHVDTYERDGFMLNRFE